MRRPARSHGPGRDQRRSRARRDRRGGHYVIRRPPVQGTDPRPNSSRSRAFSVRGAPSRARRASSDAGPPGSSPSASAQARAARPFRCGSSATCRRRARCRPERRAEQRTHIWRSSSASSGVALVSRIATTNTCSAPPVTSSSAVIRLAAGTSGDGDQPSFKAGRPRGRRRGDARSRTSVAHSPRRGTRSAQS